jgi:hypothetical protein
MRAKTKVLNQARVCSSVAKTKILNHVWHDPSVHTSSRRGAAAAGPSNYQRQAWTSSPHSGQCTRTQSTSVSAPWGRATCQPQTPAVPPSTYVQEMNFVSYPIRQTVPVVRFAGSTRPKVCYTRPNPLSISVWLCLSLWWSQKKNFLSPQENLLKVRVRVLGNGVAYLIACRGVKIYNYVLYKQ